MKAQRILPVVLAAIVMAFLNGCATSSHPTQKSIAGTWTNSLGTVWTVKPDGNFTVDLNKDGKPDAWGKCTVAGDNVTIHEANTKLPKACRVDGVYTLKETANTLHFTLVKDGCKLRAKNVLLDWTRKK